MKIFAEIFLGIVVCICIIVFSLCLMSLAYVHYDEPFGHIEIEKLSDKAGFILVISVILFIISGTLGNALSKSTPDKEVVTEKETAE